MMQILPLAGSTLLLAAAAYVAFSAVQQDIAEVAIIGPQVDAPASGPTARQIRLVPNARDDAYYTAITDRPLFTETRRPQTPDPDPIDEVEPEVAEPEAPPPPAELPTPDARLLGVLSGGARTAALLSVAGDDPQWHNIGAQIEGWTLSEIATSNVLFTENEREYRVELYQR